MDKVPFDIVVVMRRVEKAVRPIRRRPLRARRGWLSSPFGVLIACMISIRTRRGHRRHRRDLYSRVRTEAFAELDPAEIDVWIPTRRFTSASRQMRDIARRVAEEYGRRLPCDEEVPSLRDRAQVRPPGADRLQAARISVDVHIDRVTNRWAMSGAAQATMVALGPSSPSGTG